MSGAEKLVVALLVLLASSFSTGSCGEAQTVQNKEGTQMQVDVRFQASIQAKPEALEISYEFTNTLDVPVLVFDRMWDRKKQALDPDWAHVEIRGSKALISRSLGKKPQDLHFDNPPVPYGRPVAPGETLKDKFSVPLPLTEEAPYYNFTHPKGEWTELPVSEVAFALGWGRKPESLPPAVKPVDVGEDKGLLLLPYGSVEAIEKLLISSPIRVKIGGRGKR